MEKAAARMASISRAVRAFPPARRAGSGLPLTVAAAFPKIP